MGLVEPAILAGMDQEMPGNFAPDEVPGSCLFCAPLLDAVRAGRVPESRVDDAVLRILRPMMALGLFDNRPTIQPLPEEQNSAFARALSERASVLLKNAGGTLPLGATVGFGDPPKPDETGRPGGDQGALRVTAARLAEGGRTLVLVTDPHPREATYRLALLGVKGLGELSISGAGAAVANAIYNATGVRVRDFPITLDKLLAGLPDA